MTHADWTEITADRTVLESEIAMLQDEIAHSTGAMSHCERLSKMFLLRELQSELDRLQHDDMAGTRQ